MNPTRSHAPQEAWDRPFVKEHREWCDDFVLELRLRDVPGSVIGDHLAEVEAHCAETGEEPHDAFGEPVEYARQLAEVGTPDRVTGVWKVTAITSASVLALVVGTAAAGAWARGEQLSYNVVQVGSLAVFVAILLALPLLLGPLVRHPWAVGVPTFTLAMGAAVGTAAAGRLDVPALLTVSPALMCVALFAVVVVLAVAEYRELSRDDDADLVISPLPPATDVRTRGRLFTTALPAALVPLAYVVLSAVSWFTA